MKVFYDTDADLSLIKNKVVAVLGFGSQGHAHASNLHDSGVEVVVGLRPQSSSLSKVEAAGLRHASPEEAVASADVVMMLVPDEHHADLYQRIEAHIPRQATLACAHGFNIHFRLFKPRADFDVVMIAPKGPGHLVRSTYTQGQGVPTLIAVAQDVSGTAQALALSYASAIGGGRAAIIETSFREETETDLFGEQAVLCGGTTALIKAGFDTLVEAGYSPEMAYFECLHEMKLIVDLLYEGGVANMHYSISNTAEYGSVTRGDRVINQQVRAEMRRLLEEIRSGEFAKEYVAEGRGGMKTLLAARQEWQRHPLEQVGEKLRAMMHWITSKPLVDKSKN